MAANQDQKRVILWGHTRSTSTAFFRALMNPDHVKAIFEPFLLPYTFGPERISKQFIDTPPDDKYTFAGTKAMLEEDYKDYQTVFVKDISFGLTGKLEDTSYLPENYRHTFIIRNPYKAVPSYYRLCTRGDLTGYFGQLVSSVQDMSSERRYSYYQSIGMKQLYDIFKLATEELKQVPIVIDSDDLLSDPEAMLKEYCKRTGIRYDDTMIHWRKFTEEDKKVFEPWKLGFFENVINETCFRKQSDIKRTKTSHCDLSELSREAQDDLQEAIYFYNQLKAYKIELNGVGETE